TGEQPVSPVTIPPEGIQDLRGLFSTYRLYQKQHVQLKNRVLLNAKPYMEQIDILTGMKGDSRYSGYYRREPV
ncbi:MAG: hypothetical protein LBJ31_05090, partial [Treponema sp.]|nr:hypothetical protein [Treponema sp.]